MGIDFDFSRRHRPRPPQVPVPPALPDGAITLSVPESALPAALRRQTTAQAESLIWLGASGSRKSTAMLRYWVRAIAYEYEKVEPRNRRTFILNDFKGDAAEGLLQGLAAEVPQALSNTYFLNPFAKSSSDGAFPYNLARADAVGTPSDLRARAFAYLVGRAANTGVLAVPLGGRQLELIAALAHAIFESDHPNASLVWAADALGEVNGISRLASHCRSDRARRLLLSLRLPPDVLASTGTRIRSFLCGYEDLENMVAAPSCIDWRVLTAPGAVTICHLGEPPGASVELAEFFGNVLIRGCFDFLLGSRSSPSDAHAATVAIDECQMAAGALQDSLRRVLEQGRSRNVQAQLICQGTRPLRDASGALFESLLTNAAYKVSGRLSAGDASLYVREALGPGVSANAANRIAAELVSLAPGEFFFAEGDGRPRRFTAAAPDLAAWREAGVRRAAEIAAVKRRLCPSPLPPAVHLFDVPAGRHVGGTDHRTDDVQPPRKQRSRLG